MANYKDLIAGQQNKKGGIIEAFHAIQAEYNYIPQEALKEAARAFGISEARAYGVATFYSYLSVEKRGKYIVRMCESAPCHVAGADAVLEAIQKHLGVGVGETTADGKFTVELCECIGQCQATPVITVNSLPVFNVKPEDVPRILGEYK